MNGSPDGNLLTRKSWLAVIGLILGVTCLPGLLGPGKPTVASGGEDQPPQWQSLITAQELYSRRHNPKLLVIDVRGTAEYTAGHIPGAINLPGAQWRTPPTKNPQTEGPGQKIFRTPDGSVDVARYEDLLGGAGIAAEHEIVVYGNQAGKADGSLPAALLLKLGHDKVAFLDGIGLDRWEVAGYPVSTEAVKRPPTKYVARPDEKRLWSYADVLKNLGNDDVVFVDSRTASEYAGKDLRGNKRGGHIPGARLLSSDEFLDKASGTTISLDAAKQKVEKLIPKGKTVVVYCQSGTRCSHEELILKDLGYENVILYDASWQEWGNRDDAPVEKPEDREKPEGSDKPEDGNKP